MSDPDGIQIHLISEEKLHHLSTEAKLRYIVDEVREGKILVLEQGLEPVEEAKLIEVTMQSIDPDEFVGIELQSHRVCEIGWLDKLLKGRGRRGSMTVVGPGDKLKTIRRDDMVIQALIVTGKELHQAALR